MAGAMTGRRGLTLTELLVVILIIGIVSVVALPTVIPAIAHRQVSEAARVLQGALAGARDKAIHDGRPSGIRLMPDPAFNGINPTTGLIDPAYPLAYNRVVPIGPAPEYAEGMVAVQSASVLQKTPYANLVTDPTGLGKYAWPTLVLEEAPTDGRGVPNPPTSWMWNVRVGDKVQLNGAGAWYTVVGPMWVGPAAGNVEMFVNVGAPGSVSPLNPAGNRPVDYLLLTNSRDDDGNGMADEGWDGIDNNGDGLVDEHLPDQVVTVPYLPGNPIPGMPTGPPTHQTTRDEWEVEAWHGAAATGMTSVPYVIRRRPMPSPNAREIALPTQMVIDATTVFATAERSRLPVDRFTGYVDIMLNPDGTVSYTSPYGSPSSFGMADTFYHFLLMERQDITAPLGTVAPLLSVPEPAGKDARSYAGPIIKGEFALVTLFARNGQIVTMDNPPFDDPVQAKAQRRAFNVNTPFVAAQQGAR